MQISDKKSTMHAITDYLDATAARFPERIAVTDEERQLTFSAFHAESRRIASFLLAQDFRRRPVAVFMEKSASALTTCAGATYSGNFFTPLDTRMPFERLKKILEQLQPCCIITDDTQPETGEAVRKAFQQIPVFSHAACADFPADESALDNVNKHCLDTDILYVLFTSGSTGMPKGVVVSHRAAMNFTTWVTETFAIDERSRIGSQSPLYFDMSVLDIYQMYHAGASLFLIPSSYFSFPAKLMPYLKEHEIDTIYWVPSLYTLLARYHAVERYPADSLKTILFAGEVMDVSVLNEWKKVYPEALFANLYGPTETDVCTCYIVDREFKDGESLPIGFPISGADVMIIDEEDHAVTDGSQGELLVRGACLAYGYYNDPEKTAQAFIQNPLQNAYPETVYRTGDLVFTNARGELMYAGRMDHQIKIKGHRVELGEIEHAARIFPGVEGSCAVYLKTREEIVLYFEGNAAELPLLIYLKGQLPDYMIPARIVRRDFLPLNANGKTDRVLLLKEEEEGKDFSRHA